MADPVEDVLFAVARLCRSLGLTPSRVKIYAYSNPGEDKPAIVLPVSARFNIEQPRREERQAPAPAPQPAPSPPPQPGVEEDSAAVRERIACVADIIDMLRAKRFPLTETRILSELSRAGKKWRPGMVAKCLRDMVADGTVENPPDAKPRGYRLPEEPPEESGE